MNKKIVVVIALFLIFIILFSFSDLDYHIAYFLSEHPIPVEFILILVLAVGVYILYKIISLSIDYVKVEEQRKKDIIEAYKKRLRDSGIHDVDRMTGYNFEVYLKEMYKFLGYEAFITSASGDFGADIILKTENKTIAVQSKRYKNNVGVNAVQEVSSARYYYSTDEAWVVTNSYFTSQAKELARRSNVVLINRDNLISNLIQSSINVKRT